MTGHELRFSSGDHTLAGTLTVPTGGGPHAAALLLPGSGPVDRDSNHKRMRLDITRQLAEALDRAGVVTFRYDKRGVGRSSGNWKAAGLFDNVDDASAALELLAARPEVDGSRVFLVGHSEGALVATALAGRGAAVAGVVLISGGATRGEEVLLWQAEQVAPTLPAPVRLLLRVLRTDVPTRVAKNHAKLKATTTDIARVDGVRLNAKWHREFMAYDPRPHLARVRVPALALTGSKDLQVDPGDLEVIASTVPGPVETRLVPDVSHVLRRQPGPPSLSGYRKEIRQPVAPEVLDAVVDWVGKQSGGSSR